jgi:hypothetical protein
MSITNLVIPKAGVKCELLFNKPASAGVCWTSKADLEEQQSVTKIITVIATDFVTLKVEIKFDMFIITKEK